MATTAVPVSRLFSRRDFQLMLDAGLFAGEKVELLDGAVVTMSPQNTPHAATVNRLNYQLMKLCGPDIYIRVQSPVALDEYNQPEPDVVLCAPDPLDYAEEHPRPEQIFLVIEVADASLQQDRRRKARLYARNRIPQYWLVDLVHRRVEVMTRPNPTAGRYGRVRTVRAGQAPPLPNGQRIAVVDILPPPKA
jgi:Uma2 family endonuclease